MTGWIAPSVSARMKHDHAMEEGRGVSERRGWQIAWGLFALSGLLLIVGAALSTAGI